MCLLCESMGQLKTKITKLSVKKIKTSPLHKHLIAFHKDQPKVKSLSTALRSKHLETSKDSDENENNAQLKQSQKSLSDYFTLKIGKEKKIWTFFKGKVPLDLGTLCEQKHFLSCCS
jgi:hypothetical protein